jgi:hypothetical protein
MPLVWFRKDRQRKGGIDWLPFDSQEQGVDDRARFAASGL